VWCGQGRNRTADTQIFSLMLYQLSYLTAKLGDLRLQGFADWRVKQGSSSNRFPTSLSQRKKMGVKVRIYGEPFGKLY
jgi:hypothetical protein